MLPRRYRVDHKFKLFSKDCNIAYRIYIHPKLFSIGEFCYLLKKFYSQVRNHKL